MRSLLFAIVLGSFTFAAKTQVPVEPPPTDYQLEMHVRIPMRDGVHLNATLYKPVPAAAGTANPPLPVIFMLSPYPAANSHPSGSYFARRGYIYAFVDTRGRGDSEGVFHPLTQELEDGPDVVEWIARQPWSNGKVAMFGGSYAGGDQWQTAAQHPQHLTTIAPVASVRPGVDFPSQMEIANPYMLQWATYTSGHTLYESVFSDSTLWNNAAKRLYLAKAAFKEFDKYAGSTDTDFKTWLEHPDLDSYWQKYGLSREQVAGVSIPALVVTGARDGDQLGTLSYYADHITATDKATLEKYYVVIGPWDHPGTREPKADFGGEHFGPASLVDMLRLHREWYDYTMKNGSKPAFLQNHVAYYVDGAGAECWKYADSLAGVSRKSKTLYLDASGGAASLFRSGALADAQAGASGATFVSDPNDLSGAEENEGQPGSDVKGDGLIFHTAPFAEPTEIDGKIDLRLWLSIDTPDTDLGYELFLITPDGKAHFLDYSILRARYRNSFEHPEAIHEGKPEEYRFHPYQWFATRAPKGSQLRLILGAMNSPQAEKNYNSMKPVAEQTGADARVAHITLLQSKEYPSTLTLPLGDVGAACKASAEW